MNDVAINEMRQQLHPGFLDKLLIWTAWIFAGVMFFSVGWAVMGPTDPQGAVSLLARNGSLVMLLKACVLVSVTAAAATMLAGRHLPDAGVFAASVGMIVVSVRGETAAYFLIRRADDADGLGGLAMSLAGESIVWFGVVALTSIVCHTLAKSLPSITMGAGRYYLTQMPSGFDLFRKQPQLGRPSDVALTPVATGLVHALVVGVVGLAAFRVFSTGLGNRSIEHGQACFVVAAAICAACYIGHRVVPVSSALWSIVGALLLAVAGYLWSSFGGDASALPASVPSSPFFRVLPIQYAAVGAASAVVMCWYMRDPDYGTPFEPPTEKSTPRAAMSAR
jgi:hypothetical protein